MLKESKAIFAWTYKDLKGITPKLAQHKIKFNPIIPLTHQAKDKLNPNYVIKVKQDINKLLATRFIKYVEEATRLSPIVIVLKKFNESLYRFQKI